MFSDVAFNPRDERSVEVVYLAVSFQVVCGCYHMLDWKYRYIRITSIRTASHYRTVGRPGFRTAKSNDRRTLRRLSQLWWLESVSKSST